MITLNEARHIGDCLNSVKGLADEIIVVDSGSTDDTVSICQTMGAQVIQADWLGFGPQKNIALNAAQGEWVFSLDADERLSPELAEEIRGVLRNGTTHNCFSSPRSSQFCGRFMKHSGWWPDRIDRFFRRSAGRFTDDIVHERVVVNGSKGQFSKPIIHIAIEDISQSLQKMNRYSTSGAQMMLEKGKSSSLLSAVLHGWWAFMRTYFFQLGFLDGKEGFVLAICNAEGTYYRYLKLWLLQRNAGTGKQSVTRPSGETNER